MADLVSKRQFRADSASMKRVGLPFLAVAALALFVIQHLVKRKAARKRLGRRGNEDKTEDAHDEDGDSSPAYLDDPDQPMTVEELRARRIRAMEERLAKEASDPGASRLTPLGCMLRLSSQIDELEEQVKIIVVKRRLGSQEVPEDYGNLLETLSKTRKEIVDIQNDQSVREYKKVQIGRLESLITEVQRHP